MNDQDFDLDSYLDLPDLDELPCLEPTGRKLSVKEDEALDALIESLDLLFSSQTGFRIAHVHKAWCNYKTVAYQEMEM
jgi:hypothetical protein